jgi:carbamoyltransferase
MGFPEHAIAYVLSAGRLRAEDVDIIAHAGLHHYRGFDVSKIRDVFWKQQHQLFRSRLKTLAGHTPLLGLKLTREKRDLIRRLRKVGLREKALRFIEHHRSHAAAACYGCPWRGETLVLTLDGGGDWVCASVSRAQDSTLTRIAVTSDLNSIGNIYSRATFMLGFTPWEHEYKVMGMAPYSSEKQATRLKEVFDRYLDLSSSNPLVFERKIPEPTHLIYKRLRKDFEQERFDNIAAGLQAYTEKLVIKWVTEAVHKTGIRKIALAGGVFMNVKVNKLITEIPEVEDVFAFPSCGDESNAIGAAFEAFVQETGSMPESIGPVYWGPESYPTEDEIRKEVTDGFEWEEVEDMEGAIADLLIEGKIVARVAGRMEFGARALGNRSILADPSNLANVQTINRMIKMRDFWMPFAPVILAERQDDYLCRSKPVSSPYMMFAFDTQQSRRHEMAAAIHQADATARPQIIEKAWNPAYYEILRRFEKQTGRGVLLNTSYNLHGYPLVLGPAEAMWTFKSSGLEYLALGHFLIRKKKRGN